MREIVVDTETTGLDPLDGHRIIEIGCVELFDHVPTGNTFHHYLNPERLIPPEAQRVHGLTDEFLAEKPLFAGVVGELLDFFGDAPLVIHNASFDLKFLNAEFQRLSRPAISAARAIDTIEIAKAKLPGARYSLDELCKRFGIDLSGRGRHGALIDAELTARVYLELVGGRQTRLRLAPRDSAEVINIAIVAARQRQEPLPSRLDPVQAAAHADFVARELGSDAVWNWH
ncbi:MAG TPA: DNA polymerase III subunit epsilon [Rhizomicrobium sp.]|jgi:DNA polymerase-3 subunit epsilon|nr:DNA polymerase III subunit epsilon [Rhizomicrobium sp.]